MGESRITLSVPYHELEYMLTIPPYEPSEASGHGGRYIFGRSLSTKIKTFDSV